MLGMTIDYQTQFKALADRLALEPVSATALERRVLPSVGDRRRHRHTIPHADTPERMSGRNPSAGTPNDHHVTSREKPTPGQRSKVSMVGARAHTPLRHAHALPKPNRRANLRPPLTNPAGQLSDRAPYTTEVGAPRADRRQGSARSAS